MSKPERDHERLNDTFKLSPHVTRILGQNPGVMTLQGTNSYILQPPSNTNAPLILIDTSSPHTAEQYVELVLMHLHHLALQSGARETHFESRVAKQTLDALPQDKVERYKTDLLAERKIDRTAQELHLSDYGPGAQWTDTVTKERKLPIVEHIILTHRHLDHVGALPHLLKTLKEHGCPPPKLWKLPSSDEALLQASEKDRPTTDAALWTSLPEGTYQGLNPFQPFHPIMPGLMISIIDPAYRHLLKYDKDGKPRWNDVPEVARVSVRCLKTPGHTADSISLVMVEGEKGVFTGDTVLGQGTTVFTDLSAYMTSLKTLLSLKPNVIYPGHGPHLSTPEACSQTITEYIQHRLDRENQILQILLNLRDNPGTLGEKIKDCLLHIQRHKAHVGPYRDGGLGWQKVGTGENELIKGTGVPLGVWSKGEGESLEDYESSKEEESDDGGDKVSVVADFGFQEPSASQQGGRKRAFPKKPKLEDTEIQANNFNLFPSPEEEYNKTISTSLICYLIYKTDDEKVIRAGGMSVGAHLRKLEEEGKVWKGDVRLPEVLEGRVGEIKVVQGWCLKEGVFVGSTGTGANEEEKVKTE